MVRFLFPLPPRLLWIIPLLLLTINSARGADDEEFVIIKGQKAHPTRLLAKFKPGPRPARLAAAGANLTVKHQYELVPGLVVLDELPGPVLQAAGVQDKRDPKTRAAELANRIKVLNESGLFEYVEPDYFLEIAATPTDVAFVDGTLWGLRNTGQNGGVAGADIGAVQAWDITTGSSDVIVAVIDTGIRYTHRDLAANMWRNPGEIPGNGIDDDGDGYVDNVFGINAINGSGDPMDDNGHGTHVAGTIGAVANDGNPHVGVAWNVKLMACKAGDERGRLKVSDQIKCVDFAVAKGAHIINASYGSPSFSQAKFDAIARAKDRGVLFVAAAGNGGEDGIGDDNDQVPQYPSNYELDNIISVAALNRQDALADFSNFGPTAVHLGAPGVDIFSCWNGSDTDYKSIPGTSMATPHVAGVAALVLSRYPGMTVSDLRRVILNSVVPVSSLQGKTVTGGRVNAYNALNAVPDGILEITVQPPPGSTLLAGSTVPLIVSVSDVAGVQDATVTATITGFANLTFNNSGVPPDAVANDANYSASFTVPPFATGVTLNLSVSAPGKDPTNLAIPYEIVPPAVNDAFAKRTPLPSETDVLAHGSNTRATRETGEPYHGVHIDLAAGGKSVWWTWTAPVSGFAVVTTAGSDFDTLLAVYTGTSVTGLSPIASNDDWIGQFTYSVVTFDAAAGTSYEIAVDGFGGASGNINLRVALHPPAEPPTNDDFQNRVSLESELNESSGVYHALAEVETAGATKEPAEPDHAGNQGGRSVWFTWTAPVAGFVDLTTGGGNFDTLLAVYTGTSVSSLTLVAANDDEGPGIATSRVKFFTGAGATYQIAVDGFDSALGIARLSLTLVPPASGPANDRFENATAISGASATVSGSNAGASRDSGEPNHAGNAGGASIWWDWTAPANGVTTITTAGSSFDTLLAVYTGTAVAALMEVASNDDDSDGGTTSAVRFNAVSGTSYRIAVDGYRSIWGTVASGNVTLNLTLDTGERPANDDFANRAILAGNSVTTSGSNIGATIESASEPFHADNIGGRSVWWTWTAPLSVVVEISTAGSNFDTLLAVYTGNSVSSLTDVANNDDDSQGGNTSRVVFNAVAGVAYQIAVDGYDGAAGNITLSIRPFGRMTELYSTSFNANEGYTAGTALAGQNGWLKLGSGGGRIVDNFFPDLGQQAYIGFNPPAAGENTTFLWQPLDITPGADQVVLFSVLMRIVDSTNDRHDVFRWAVFNRNEDELFWVSFDNSTLNVLYVLDDGVARSTGRSFDHDTIYHLIISMDFENNTWGASLDGETIIDSMPITTKGAARNLGDIDAVWILRTLDQPGDNYMLFDNYRVDLLETLFGPSFTVQPQSQTITADSNASFSATATGTAPLSYQWYHDGAVIEGATSAALSLANVHPDQAGRYWVVATNPIGSAASDEAVLLVTPLMSVPPNDNFASRITVTGASNVVAGFTFAATKETSEPLHAENIGGRSVWWSWTAPSTGKFLVTTAGSDFDTLLGIYTGSSLASLSLRAGSDDFQSQTRSAAVTLNAVGGTTYQIAVDGYNGDAGNVRLAIKPVAPLLFSQPGTQPGGVFQAEFAGEPGVRYLIQVSTDLVNWSTVATIMGADGTVNYFDTEAAGAAARFYRAVQEP